MPHIADIRIYPMKSLDPIVLDAVRVMPSGNLEGDRRWAFIDAAGKVWNAKRSAAFHRIRASFDFDTLQLSLKDATGEGTFHMESERDALEAWMAERLGGAAWLREDSETGLPDDLESPGPTVISTATLETIASWFPGVTVDSVRQRLRSNIEIGGVEAFWEDRLYREDRSLQPVRMGDVTFGGVNPCQRCVVPSRDPATGQPTPLFQKTFNTQRRTSLPPWAAASRFDHYYRAAVNTRLLAGAGETLRVGDAVEIVEPVAV